MKNKKFSRKFNPSAGPKAEPLKNAESRMTIEDGDRVWRNAKGQFHRLDGPAIEWANGGEFWYADHQLHREDGPAVVRPDGSTEWWFRGRPHRADGPAVELTDGRKEWWLHGRQTDAEEIDRNLRRIRDEQREQDMTLHREKIERLDKIAGRRPKR